MTDSPKPGAAEDEFVPSGDTVSDAIIVKLARANTEAQARIAELERELSLKESERELASCDAYRYSTKIAEIELLQLRPARARIRELEAELAAKQGTIADNKAWVDRAAAEAARRIEEAAIIAKRDLERIRELKRLISDLADEDNCSFDHHGYCQAHGWMVTEPKCPHARAKEVLGQ